MGLDHFGRITIKNMFKILCGLLHYGVLCILEDAWGVFYGNIILLLMWSQSEFKQRGFMSHGSFWYNVPRLEEPRCRPIEIIYNVFWKLVIREPHMYFTKSWLILGLFKDDFTTAYVIPIKWQDDFVNNDLEMLWQETDVPCIKILSQSGQPVSGTRFDTTTPSIRSVMVG